MLPIGSARQQVTLNIAAGVMSLLLFQVVSDYKNLRLMSNLLDKHLMSFHVGARVHQSHRNVMERERAISKFLGRGDTLRLLTTTADDYVIDGSRGYEPLRRKLQGNLKVEILLFTPVFYLRSFIDWSKGDTNAVNDQVLEVEDQEDQRHGQKHMHASKLIQEQRDHIIPALRTLQKEFPGKIDVKFFHLKHHVNMAIYGTRRIFAAPLLSNTKGRELPCLEVFPGLVDAVLFEKLSGEFSYLWNNPKLVFSMDEISSVYDTISRNIPDYFTRRWMDATAAGWIEKFAHGLIRSRIEQDHIETKTETAQPQVH
jgi:hypothetical protein